MTSKDFDTIKNIFEEFVKENRFSILNSKNDFITNETLDFLNDKNTGFKKTLETNINKDEIEMSKVIKGDFIIFENYDLFQYENISYDSDNHNSSEQINVEPDFTESFEHLF